MTQWTLFVSHAGLVRYVKNRHKMAALTAVTFKRTYYFIKPDHNCTVYQKHYYIFIRIGLRSWCFLPLGISVTCLRRV